MKLVTFSVNTLIGPMNRLGVLVDQEGTRIADLTGTYASYLAAETDESLPYELAALRTPPDMIGWLKGGRQSRLAADESISYLRQRLGKEIDPLGPRGERLVFARSEVKLLAPVPRPRSLRCFSVYEEHMTRAGKTEKSPMWYKWPPYYKGNPDAIIGPEDPIPYPCYTEKLDIEIELGIIVGREGRNLTPEQAIDHIAGFTIFLDPSARDGYGREPFGPTKRKDFCSVLGPCLVTADEIDETNLNVRTIVDGETWFEGNTGHRRHYLAQHIIAYASDNETIYPGDVLASGTIGFGCSMDLHRWVKVGQTATYEIEGIGSLTHKIVAGERIVDYVLNGIEGLLKQPSASAEKK